ncbi:hypothetical protein QQ045_010006 [Rhodiola kirilowii]
MAMNSPLLTKKTTTDKLQQPASKRPKRREVSNGRTTENVSKKARKTLYRTNAECLEGGMSIEEDMSKLLTDQPFFFAFRSGLE